MPSLGDIDRALIDAERPSWRVRRRRARGLPPFAAFGAGSSIGWPRTVTMPEVVSIGSGVRIGDFLWIAITAVRAQQVTQGELAPQGFRPRLTIGDCTRLGRDVTLACLGEMAIGSDVFGGDRLLIADTYHEYSDPAVAVAAQPMAAPRPVRIGDGVFLGSGTIVNPGVTIGDGAVVCAASVVTRDVPAGATVGGSPARQLR